VVRYTDDQRVAHAGEVAAADLALTLMTAERDSLKSQMALYGHWENSYKAKLDRVGATSNPKP
jgi:hypothetical protein